MSTRKRAFTRRRLLIAGGALVACPVACLSVPAYFGTRGPDRQSNVGELDFTNPLAIPPLLEPVIDADGTKRFDLTLQTGSANVFGEGETETWGINGPFLAPTLRAKRGERVAIDLHNELPEETTIHWHGMHLPAAMDGGPHQMIDMGQTWSPHWEIEQPAATLWYHPHPHGNTASHVYRGIAGLFLIDDDEEAALDLPRTWGVDDIPLIIQDKRRDGDDFSESAGSFFDNFTGSTAFGIRGDTILINGTYDPRFEVTTRVVRFRLLNGSNTRFYNVGFADDRTFHLLATESGLVPGALPELKRLLIGPGERAEILGRFEPGEEVIFRSFEQDLDVGGTITRQIGGEDTFELIRFVAADDLGGVQEIIAEAKPGEDVPVPEGVTERSFELQGHTEINGEKMDMNRIDVVVPAGAAEVWRVTSNNMPHTFHVHGASFRVLEVNGEAPPDHLRGPKDTVKISPGHEVRLLVQFLRHVDAEMPYMFHCHILRHEDQGMMGQFVVVEPGAELVTPTRLDVAHSRH